MSGGSPDGAASPAVRVGPVPPERGGLVLVVGMIDAGVEMVGEVLEALGCASVSRGPDGAALADLCDSLLADLGATPTVPVLIGRDELWARLAPRAEEARSVFRAVVGEPEGDADGDVVPAPLVWADPRLTLLAPFWVRVIGAPATIVHVHRRPGPQAAELVAGTGLDLGRAFEVWDEVNRAAMALWEERSGLVLGIEATEDDPDTAVDEVVAFVATLGVHPTAEQRKSARSVVDASTRLERDGPADVPNRFSVLHHVLDLTGRTSELDAEAVVGTLAGFYDEDYYVHYGSEGGAPYRPGQPEWVSFFSSVADRIVDELRPGTALDAGCAVGFLVAALQDRGVEAHGVDVSAWAIGQAPERIRSRVRTGSLTDELDGHYDLITCIEVIEHLPEAVADRVVGNLTRHAGAVLFSSTPDGFEEATHLNVRPPAHWSRLFAAHGFVRDPDYDASYLSHEAVLYVPGDTGVDAVLTRYEAALWRTTTRLVGQVAERDRQMAEQAARVSDLEASVAALDAEAERLRVELRDQGLDHQARSLALRKDILDARREAGERSEELSAVRAELADVRAQLDAAHRTLPFRLRAAAGRLSGRARRVR
jgi:SAM-dependent methyltransferase